MAEYKMIKTAQLKAGTEFSAYPRLLIGKLCTGAYYKTNRPA